MAAEREQIEAGSGSTVPCLTVRWGRAGMAVWAAAVGVLVVVVAGAVVWSRGGGASEGRAAGSAERFFVLSGLPADFAVTTILSPDGVSSTPVASAYFGDGGADDPFASTDALVMAAPVSSEVTFDDRGAAVFVHGVTGTFSTTNAMNDVLGFAAHTLVFETVDRRVIVLSRHLDQAGLVAFADALVFDATGISLAKPVPGMDRIGPAYADSSLLGPSMGMRWLVSYHGAGGSVSLSVGHGDRDLLRVMRWWGATPTEVDGHSGVLTVAPQSSGPDGPRRRSLTWLLDGGALLSVSAVSSTLDVRALAAQVREVTALEWDTLRASLNTARVAPASGAGTATAPSAPPTSIPTAPTR